MRSVATHSWAAAQAEDLTGSDNTHAWRRRASGDANSVIPASKAQEESLNALKDSPIGASGHGRQRLLAAESDLPMALWILVFVSIFVLTAVLTALLRNHPNRKFAIAVLAGVFVISTVMLSTLTRFDGPVTQGDGVQIPPRALNAVTIRLQGTYPSAAREPCEALADH